MPQEPHHVLPSEVDLPALGLAADELFDVVSLRPGTVFRLICRDGTSVLKWYGRSGWAREIDAYELLWRLEVPTVAVLATAFPALLLEDIEQSPVLRLACDDDLDHADTGAAVAHWYRTLHDAGAELIRSAGPPDPLGWATDGLTADAVMRIAKRLSLSELPVWRRAAEYLDPLVAAARALPSTITHNDFHWTNLALPRSPEGGEAVVFDYHLLAQGLAYADYRNVCWSLRGAANATFRDAYGPVDDHEVAADGPLSILCALREATSRPSIPRWSLPLVEEVRDGQFATKLSTALECFGIG